MRGSSSGRLLWCSVLALQAGGCCAGGMFGRRQGVPSLLADAAEEGASMASAASGAQRFDVTGAIKAAGGAVTMEVLLAYSAWQTAELARPDLPCTRARATVYHGGKIGFGADASTMAYVFLAALAEGRMFFVDWPLNKRATLKFSDVVVNRHFPWGYDAAVARGKLPDRRRKCGVDMAPKRAVLHVVDRTAVALRDEMRESTPGTITDTDLCGGSHGIAAPPGLEGAFPDAELCALHVDTEREMLVRRFLLQPARRVVEFYAEAAAQLHGKFVIATVVRTGRGEKSKAHQQRGDFLRARDEFRFIKCWRAAAEQLDPQLVAKRPVAALLVTDDISVFDEFKKAAAPGETVVLLPGSVVHTTESLRWGPEGETNGGARQKGHDGDVDQGLLKAFADFFLLRFANVAFLTVRSFFGRIAVSLADDIYGVHYVWNGHGGGAVNTMPEHNPFGHGCRVITDNPAFSWTNRTTGNPFTLPPVVNTDECEVRARDNARLNKCADVYLANPGIVIVRSCPSCRKWGALDERAQRKWHHRRCDDFATKLKQARQAGSVAGVMNDVSACAQQLTATSEQ